MIDQFEAAAEKVRAATHEHREQGDGFAQLCKSLDLDPEELTTFIDGEVEKLNGTGTVDGALLHGLLTGAVVAQEATVGDGIDWATVGKLLPPHELRKRILLKLLEGQSSPNQLAAALDEPLSNVSYHVKALAGTDPKAKKPIRETPLVELVDTAQRRGALEHFYALTETARTQPESTEEADANAA